MEILGTSFFWVTLTQIIMINIVLSGDNAVVIALASRSLPAKQQKAAILFGSFGAIGLRVVLTFFAVMLLGLPYLKIIGAVLLGWIGIQMLQPEGEDEDVQASAYLWAAIKTIIIADFIMSLDNVLGVAAAAKGSLLLLIVGLGISIPIIIYGSTLVLKMMQRWPIIVTVGGGVLGWVAGEMLVTDPVVQPWIDLNAHWMHDVTPAFAAGVVVAAGKSYAAWTVDVAKRAIEAVPPPREPAPPGYRWTYPRWSATHAGTRDYAAFHGFEDFPTLRPMSSRMRSPNRWRALFSSMSDSRARAK